MDILIGVGIASAGFLGGYLMHGVLTIGRHREPLRLPPLDGPALLRVAMGTDETDRARRQK